MQNGYAHLLRNALPVAVSLILNAKHHIRALGVSEVTEKRRTAALSDLGAAEKRLRDLERDIEKLDMEGKKPRSLCWWRR